MLASLDIDHAIGQERIVKDLPNGRATQQKSLTRSLVW
jgi:hypothetical protein